MASSLGDRLRALPIFLKVWIALQVVGFTVGAWLNPAPIDGLGWQRLLFWVFVAVLLAYGMARRSTATWAVAIFFGLAEAFFGFTYAADPANGSTIWGLQSGIRGVLELAVLCAPSSRAWIRQKSQRATDDV